MYFGKNQELIDEMDILMNDSVRMYVAVPHTREALLGTIDGTNKLFTLKDYPLYPQSQVKLTPSIADIIVEGVLASGTPPVNAYTVLTASAINEITDVPTGDMVPGAVELATAPAIAAATGIVGTFFEQIEPFVAQDITPTVKQDDKEIKRIGSVNIMHGYGSIDYKIKSDQIISNDSVQLINKLLYGPYTGNDTVETGFTAAQQLPKPMSLKGHIPITDDYDDVIGVFKFDKCKISPDLPGFKQGDAGKFTIDMSVQTTPVLLTPIAA